LILSRVVWDYSSNSFGGGNDTSKAKYWCLVTIVTNATETDSEQVPLGDFTLFLTPVGACTHNMTNA